MSISVESPEPNSKKVLLLVSPSLFDRLTKLAAHHKIPRNDLMRQLLVYAADELESKTQAATKEAPTDDHDEDAPETTDLP